MRSNLKLICTLHLVIVSAPERSAPRVLNSASTSSDPKVSTEERSVLKDSRTSL